MKTLISGKRGPFWDPRNQLFLRNRGLFKVKVSEKGYFFYVENTDVSH